MRFIRPKKPLSISYKWVASRMTKELTEYKHDDIWLCVAKDGSYRIYRDYQPILIGCLIRHYDREHLPTPQELKEFAEVAPWKLKWFYCEPWDRRRLEQQLKAMGLYKKVVPESEQTDTP